MGLKDAYRIHTAGRNPDAQSHVANNCIFKRICYKIAVSHGSRGLHGSRKVQNASPKIPAAHT